MSYTRRFAINRNFYEWGLRVSTCFKLFWKNDAAAIVRKPFGKMQIFIILLLCQCASKVHLFGSTPFLPHIVLTNPYHVYLYCMPSPIPNVASNSNITVVLPMRMFSLPTIGTDPIGSWKMWILLRISMVAIFSKSILTLCNLCRHLTNHPPCLAMFWNQCSKDKRKSKGQWQNYAQAMEIWVRIIEGTKILVKKTKVGKMLVWKTEAIKTLHEWAS